MTIGRGSAEGVVPLSHTFDTPGLLARSVSDAAYGFAALDRRLGDPMGFIAKTGRQTCRYHIGTCDRSQLHGCCDPSSVKRYLNRRHFSRHNIPTPPNRHWRGATLAR